MRARIRARAARIALLVTATAAALAFVVAPAPAAKKSGPDRFRHAAYDTFHVRSIGILPVAVLRPDKEAPRILREHLERALQTTGYRFLDEGVLRSSARAAGLEDTLEVLENAWGKSGNLDTLALRALGASHVVDAVLAAMVMTWERSTIDPSVDGYSITQIGVRLALYSTRTGELLWRESLQEEGQGPYNNPGQTIIGVQGSTLGNTARTSTALEPPTYDEVATKLERKMRAAFPPLPKAAPEVKPASSRPSDKFGAGEPAPGAPGRAG